MASFPAPVSGLPPAGWYFDGTGQRWWDGQTWGPYAPNPNGQPGGGSNDKVLAVLSHLGILLGGFVLPLVVRLTTGERDEFVRHHSTEALNFNITFMVGYLVSWVGAFSLTIVTHNEIFFLLIPLVMLWLLVAVVFSVIGAVRAHRGDYWTYPLSIRLVKGARPKAK
jgi:uncharacterized protein